MSDRVHSITVVLEKDIRSDDAEWVINAIKMIRGVLSVTPSVSSIETHMAEERARHALGQQLIAIIYPKDK